MLGHTYNHKIIQKTVSAFGTLFNDIELIRQDSSGNEIKRIPIPLMYVQKRDWFYKKYKDISLDHHFANKIPRIGFEMSSLSYDSSRKLPSLGKLKNTISADTKYQYRGVPYLIGFSLFLETENLSDMTQLLEQILPYFGPTFNITSNVIPDLGIEEDISVTLTSVSPNITYQGQIGDIKNIEYELSFDVRINLRSHIIDDTIIRHVITNIYSVVDIDDTENEEIDIVIDVVPEPIDAEPDEEYTFNTTITET